MKNELTQISDINDTSMTRIALDVPTDMKSFLKRRQKQLGETASSQIRALIRREMETEQPQNLQLS